VGTLPFGQPQGIAPTSSRHLNDEIDQIQHGNGRYRPDHRSFDIHRGIERTTMWTTLHTYINRLFAVTAGNLFFLFFHFIFFRKVGAPQGSTLGVQLPTFFIINLSTAFAISCENMHISSYGGLKPTLHRFLIPHYSVTH